MKKLVLFLLLIIANIGFAQEYPPGFTEVVITNEIVVPTAMAFAPDGRIFVTTHDGEIRVIKNGQHLPNWFIRIHTYSGGERGLTGIVLDPNFAQNKYLYVYYTFEYPNQVYKNRISRFTANGDTVAVNSEKIIWELDELKGSDLHVGGMMKFAADGSLLLGVGDDTFPPNSQNLDSYFGKILRFNLDGSIPKDNPFQTGSEQKKRIWAYGLRNPFTLDIHPVTNKIYINDVGQDGFEEIDDATLPGRNFGWPNSEGPSDDLTHTDPVYAYPHPEFDEKDTCTMCGYAITGGTFLSSANSNYPAKFRDKYFFQEFQRNWIAYLDENNKPVVFAKNIKSFSIGLSMGLDGNFYYLSRGSSSLIKIVYTSNEAPSIIEQPKSLTVNAGQKATFSVTSSGTAPLSYQWLKNGTEISGATSMNYVINVVQSSDAGEYSVRVSNVQGTITSNKATLTVIEFNTSPQAVINSPVNNTKYVGGQQFNFSGSATDKEDGFLPASAFSWKLDFHHNDHVHDGAPFARGQTSASITIPTKGETATDVFYRLYLFVTDSKGAKDTTYVDLQPTYSTFTVKTDPEGLSYRVDSKIYNKTSDFLSVVGIERLIGVEEKQMLNEIEYEFDKWDQGGTALQIVNTPMMNTTYSAKFKAKITAIEKFNPYRIKIYPNPTTGKIYLKADNQSLSGKINLQLIDLLGKEFVKVPLQLDQSEVSVDLSPYFQKQQLLLLRIYNEKNELIYTSKLLADH